MSISIKELSKKLKLIHIAESAALEKSKSIKTKRDFIKALHDSTTCKKVSKVIPLDWMNEFPTKKQIDDIDCELFPIQFTRDEFQGYPLTKFYLESLLVNKVLDVLNKNTDFTLKIYCIEENWCDFAFE